MINKSTSSMSGLTACLAMAVMPVAASAAEVVPMAPVGQSETVAGSDADWSFQRRGGGGGRAGASRPAQRPPGDASRPAQRPSTGAGRPGGAAASGPATRPGAGGAGQQYQVRHNANANINHNANVNQNINRNTNINRDVNVNVDNRYYGGGYRGYGDDWDYPFARAAAVTAGVAVTAAAIGSMTRTLPPSCATVIVNGYSYYQCGSTWYQPQYSGTTVQYVVINSPQ